DFLRGRSIFITGATGFLGKVLIEKLLASCSDINNVYILLRTKGTVQASKRLTELLESRVFDRIRHREPKLLQKVRAIRGDVTFDELAISNEDLNTLKNDVSVIIHSAATIRFDEPLKRAIRLNVTATKRVLELAYKLPYLCSFVHVSTAYCNNIKTDIQEIVYQEPLSAARLIELSEVMSDDMLESLSGHLFRDRPSSYHYTKAMAENLVREHCNKLPIAIVRPSIITASFKDPFPGWVDNYNGPSGYLVVAGKGILRTMLVDGNKICDMIPVDIVANTIIASAWFVANTFNHLPIHTTTNDKDAANSHRDQILKKYQQLQNNDGQTYSWADPDQMQPFVVNCTSGQLNPITWNEVRDLSHPYLVKYPSVEMFRYPGPIFVSNKLAHKILVAIEHDLPTYAIDLLFKVLGHHPMLGPIYQKVHRTSKALEHFTTNEWIYRNSNFVLLNRELSSEDKKLYPLDVKSINWASYMEDYVLGVRKYLLREDPGTIKSAKFKLDLLYYATQMAKLTAISTSAFCFYYVLKASPVRRLLNAKPHS
ncbi:Fatty acyl-CoA reductase 1, partial [Fragariocoptes setiger]